jgi:hypothetical protein
VSQGANRRGKLLSKDEARRIAANIKLPHLYFAPMTIAQ